VHKNSNHCPPPAAAWVISTGSGSALQCESKIRTACPDDEIIRTRDRHDLTDWRQGLPSSGLIIIAGGDGAWREALQSAPDQVIPGLLPVGSLNQAAIELDTTADITGWRNWRQTDIQLGNVAGDGNGQSNARHHIFFLMAGVGVESDAVALVRPRLKQWLGKWAYVAALLERLLHPVRKTMVVGIDGRHFRTSQVLVQNGAHYGGRYQVADSNVFTAGYDVLVWKYPGRFMWCLTMMCLMFGLPSGWLAYKIPATQLLIRSKGKMHCQLDGDTGPMLPLYISPTSTRKIAIPSAQYE